MEHGTSTGAEMRRDAWFSYFIWWQRLSWLLLVWIAVGSTIAAAQLCPAATTIVSLTVAAASSLLAALQPQQRASAYRRAWVVLDGALAAAAGIPPDVLAAVAAGEGIIGEPSSAKAP